MARLDSLALSPRARLESIAWWKFLAAAMLIGAGLRVGVAVLRPLDLAYDEPTFVELANNLYAGHGLAFSEDMYGVATAGQPTSFEEPVYPLWLAFLRLVAGTGDIRTLRVIQALFSTLIVLLAFLLGSTLFSRSLGLMAAGATAVWPSLVYFSAFLQQEALYVLILPLALLATLAFARTLSRPDRSWYPLALGALWGVAILIRGSTAIFLPVIVVWLALAKRESGWRALMRTAAIMAVGVVVVLTPWWIRNYQVQGAFVPLTTKGGYNLYHWDYPISNPDFDSFGVDVPQVNGSEVQRDHAYTSMAIAAMVRQPLTVLQDLAVKGIKFFRPVIGAEGPSKLSLPFAVALLAVYAGALGQMFGLGYRGNRQEVALLWIALALELVLAMLFFSNNRARLPVELLLIVLASACLVRLAGQRISA